MELVSSDKFSTCQAQVVKVDTRIQTAVICNGNYTVSLELLGHQRYRGLQLSPSAYFCVISGNLFVCPWFKDLQNEGKFSSQAQACALLILVMEVSYVQLLHLFKLACDSHW